MSLDIDDGGIDKNLLRLSKGNTAARKRALTKASDVIKTSLKRNTPVWTGKNPNNTHARDHIIASKPKADKSGELSIRVGFDKKVVYRIKFAELGTVHQPPQGFIKRTAEENNAVILQIIASELRRELGL